MERFYNIFKYIHIFPLLKENSSVYLGAMQTICAVIILVEILITFMIYRIYNNQLNILWPLTIIRIFISFFFVTFFGHILLYFITLFYCDQGHSYISNKLQCRGQWYLNHIPSVLISMVLLLKITLLTNLLYFKSPFSLSTSDILKKKNTIPDISFSLTKIIINILFVFGKRMENNPWFIILLLLLVSGTNAYINFFYANRMNKKLALLSIILSLITFNGYFALLVGNILQAFNFNGSIYFYILINIITIFIIFYYKKINLDFTLMDYTIIKNSYEFLEFIFKFYILVKTSKIRNNITMLNSYIFMNEKICTNIDCPLKKYLKNIENGIDSPYFLYNYIEMLFKFGISKFRDNCMLKIYYSFFLLEELKLKEQALIILNSIEEDSLSFQLKYFIFKSKKVIDIFPSSVDNYYYQNRTKFKEFKKLILNDSKLYNEFWSLLYANESQSNERFKKLYTIGSKILELNKKIDDIYKILIKTKKKNIEIFNLYSDYIENILGDEEKYQENQRNKNLIYSETFENEEINYSNFNMEFLKQKGDERYLIISGNKKGLGTILDCSPYVSRIFGYQKKELIGKHINILIPELFHSKHNEILLNKANSDKFNLFNSIYQKRIYEPNIIEKCFYGALKSKFIEAIQIKIYFIKTEENFVGFIAEIINSVPYMNSLVKSIDNENNERYCILTNDNFIIYSFTPNSVENLNLNYKYIKGNNSIVPFIKELYEDYLSLINNIDKKNYGNSKDNVSMESSSSSSDVNFDLENIPSEIKRKIKKELAEKKYNKKCQITWRIIEKKDTNDKNKTNTRLQFTRFSEVSTYNSHINLYENKSNHRRIIEIELNMEIKKALNGYFFYFYPKNENDYKNIVSYNAKENLEINDRKEVEYNQILTKSKKYKCIIRTLKLEDGEKNGRNKKYSISVNPKKINKENSKNENKETRLSNKKKKKSRKSISIDRIKFRPSQVFIEFENDNSDFTVDENFIPEYTNYFKFDLSNTSYKFEKDINSMNNLNSILKKEAMNKIKEFHENLKSMKKDKKEIDFSDSSESGESAEDENDSEISESKEETEEVPDEKEKTVIISPMTKTNSIYLKKHSTLKSKRKSYIETHLFTDKNQIIKKLFDENEVKNKQIIENKRSSSVNKIVKIFNEKNIMNKYYEVNLNNIHFMIYDFNKDMLVDGNKNEVNIKIKKILNGSNNNEISFSGRDEDYPNSFLSLKHKSTLKKKIVDEENKNKQNEIIDKESSYKRKINDAINNQEDETTIKKLKRYSLLFFITMISCSGINLYLNLYYNYMFKSILYLIKNSISIKYCNRISLYYIRELTLLNLNIPNLKGGEYIEIPAKKSNREGYRKLIRDKLTSLFIENQSYLKEIFSSSYSPSENASKILSEFELYPGFISNKKYEIIKSDILSTLIQYNNAFYNLAMSDIIIEQNHPELFNFVHNGFNEYGKGILILIDIYKSELSIQKKRAIIILICFLIVYFFLYLIINIFIMNNYLSAEITRKNYMKVFYGINLDSLKYLMTNCEKYLEYLKKTEKNMNNDDESKNDEEDKGELIKKTNENGKRNIPLLEENKYKSEKESISLQTIIFFIIYYGFLLGMYIYFVYNFFCMVDLINYEINISNFYYRLSIYHLSIIDLFNSFREYIYDDTSIIFYKTSFDYIKETELIIDDSINKDTELVRSFATSILLKYEGVQSLIMRDMCSFFFTDYFESIEECQKEFDDIKYGYLILATSFAKNIHYAKYIATYFLRNKNIVGNLTEYDKEKWITMGNNFLEQEGDKPAMFRLDLFNEKELHTDLNLIFINIFLPYIQEVRRVFIDKITIEGKENLVIKLFIIYQIMIFFVFFIYWVPKINFVSNYIYRTKKILLIIPINILASQNNIKSVLNL